MLKSVVGLFSADAGLAVSGEGVVDAVECARAAVRAQLDAARVYRVALVVLGDAEPQQVVAEESHLLRAIENLIVNAVRHSPPDGTVAIRIDAAGDEVAITVEDEGDGVAPGAMVALFDPFAKGAGSGGQAGLGLFYCKRAVERWGGRIAYEPNSPKGAKFFMRLKRARE
jgi:signal transduction histidine kinase